jgi:hypothetical protein
MAAPLPLARQNDLANLAKQAAARVWYGEAARLGRWRFGLVVALPVLAGVGNALWALFWPTVATEVQQLARSLTALTALALWLLDEMLMRPFIERRRRQAATAQEMFDTTVLDIPWNDLLVGRRPQVADITKAGEALLRNPAQKAQLIDWYRPELLTLEPTLGRVMAQRMNVWWDRDLRETYVWMLIVPCLALLVVPFWAVAVNRSFADAVLILACLLPAARALWLAIAANRAAIRRLGGILTYADRIRDECATTPLSAERAYGEARRVQDALFVHRSSVPVGLQWVYQRSRESNETAYAAEIADLRAKVAGAASASREPPRAVSTPFHGI